MQDDFQPVRYLLSGYDASKDVHPSGDLVAYSDFQIARMSRDHWKAKAERHFAVAVHNEKVIAEREAELEKVYAELSQLRASLAR